MKNSQVIAIDTTKELSDNLLDFRVQKVASFDEYLVWIEACDVLGRVPTQAEWVLWSKNNGPNGPGVA